LAAEAVEMIPKAKVAAKSKGEQSPQEKGEGDEGAKESEPDDPPITNLKELLLAMKPRFAPELKDSKIYIHTIKVPIPSMVMSFRMCLISLWLVVRHPLVEVPSIERYPRLGALCLCANSLFDWRA